MGSDVGRSPLGTAGALCIVAVAWAALQLYGLGWAPFHTRGEPREAIVVQDLVRHGRWLLPRRNATEVPRKPALYYWLGGLAAHAGGGVDERSARLPSAVMSGAAVLLLTLVTALTVTPRAAGIAGLTLLTSFEWLRAATSARVDMTLAFGLTAVFAALLLARRGMRGQVLVLLYGGMAWATLSKGIPGLAIPTIVVLLVCAMDRSWAFARGLRPGRGVLAVLLIVGAWYGAALLQGGRAFLDVVVGENLLRITDGGAASFGHAHGLAYLVGALAAGLLPWVLGLPAVALALWRDRAALERHGPPVFALLWIAAVFAPYAFATSKRGVYLLPLYPAVALLVGSWADQILRGAGLASAARSALTWTLWPLALVLVLFALMLLAGTLGLPLLDTALGALHGRGAAYMRTVVATAAGVQGWWLTAGTGAAALCAAAGALAARAPRPTVLFAALFGCTAMLILAARLAILPAIAALDTRHTFVSALRQSVRDPALVHTDPQLDYGTLFYWGGAMPVYDAGGGGEIPPYLIMPQAAWRRADAALRERYEVLRSACMATADTDGCPVALARRTAGTADRPAPR